MTKSSIRRLQSHPFLIRMKSRIENEGKEPYLAAVTLYGWPMKSDEKSLSFARCRINKGDDILYGDLVEIDRKNVIEIRKL